MASTEERKKILKMVSEGKITAEEAARLLSALSRTGKGKQSESSGKEPRWLRVKVTDVHTGRAKVNVNLPFSMVQVGLKMGAKFVPDMDGVDLDGLSEALRSGMTGKIIDIVDEEDAQRVEVYVE